MKTLEWTGIGVFVAGLVPKLMHVPYSTIVLLAIVAAWIPASVFGLLKQKDRVQFSLRINIAIAMFGVVSYLKFFPFAKWILLLALLHLLVNMYYVVKNRAQGFQPVIVAAVFCLVCTAMRIIPSDKLYYFTSIKYNAHTNDYISWDKYSWFLYLNERYDEAEQASNKALSMAEEVRDEEIAGNIRVHREKIESRNWKSFFK